LQGLHEVKRLSKASVVGGLTGLFVGVPLYYLYGTEGIVPGMIALSAAMFTFYYISLRKSVKTEPFRFSKKTHIAVIRRMIGMGIILMASDLIGTSVSYGINLFIRTIGSYDDVGLYQAANSATAQYSGMVFTAMAMDYFPRLTKAASDNRLMHVIVNRQSEIVSLIIAPASCLLILAAPLVIRVLFTEEFRPVLPLLRWMGFGLALRALHTPMAYITFAKDNKKVFFYLEGLFGNILTFALSCIGFYFFGLIGVGYAFVADNAICIVVYYVVNRHLYDYRFSRQSLTNMAAATTVTLVCFLTSLIHDTVLSYSLMGVSLIFSLVWGLTNLRRKLKSPDELQTDDRGQ
ncbi:MAG: oligosaccharide flippase family protein, partial [Muribaculaceae bacterium]|nr:oligosaccharide flippase family protein [Muribaculaceae bacterium]